MFCIPSRPPVSQMSMPISQIPFSRLTKVAVHLTRRPFKELRNTAKFIRGCRERHFLQFHERIIVIASAMSEPFHKCSNDPGFNGRHGRRRPVPSSFGLNHQSVYHIPTARSTKRQLALRPCLVGSHHARDYAIARCQGIMRIGSPRSSLIAILSAALILPGILTDLSCCIFSKTGNARRSPTFPRIATI